MSFCPSKNDVILKITILLLDFDQMLIFHIGFEEKQETGMTSKITIGRTSPPCESLV
jgi:hypothetical protein